MRVLFSIISVLILSFTLCHAEQKTDNKIEIKVLEERLKNNEDKTNLQMQALENQFNLKVGKLDERLILKAEMLETRVNLYLRFILALFAVVSFLGYKTVLKWIKQTIEEKTDNEIKKHVTKEYVEELIREKGEEAIVKLLSELEQKAKEKISEIEALKKSYETSLEGLKNQNLDMSNPFSENTGKNNLEGFVTALVQTKLEEKYTYDDWLYKGSAEFKDGKYLEAIKSWTKAIEKDQTRYEAYNNRGLAYARLGQHEEAIKDFNKAIELSPGEGYYLSRGVVYVNMGQYEKAEDDYKKSIELGKGIVGAYLNLAELRIIKDNYEKALEEIEKVKTFVVETKSTAVHLYLEGIIKKLLDMDTSNIDLKLEVIFASDFTIKWSFNEIESWLTNAPVSEDKKTYIREKTEMMKKHKKQ